MLTITKINSKGCVLVPKVIQNGLNLITRHIILPVMFQNSWNQFQGYIMIPNVI